jgi:hypothetical protein
MACGIINSLSTVKLAIYRDKWMGIVCGFYLASIFLKIDG